jgi:hypothetical protein
MSSRFRLTCVALPAVMAFLVLGCVDPKEQFDEFGGRVVDAAPPPDTGGGAVFDITGSFLLAIQAPVGNDPIRFLVTSVFTAEGDAGTADLTFQALKFDACNPAGNGGTEVGDSITINDVPVDASGTFDIMQQGTTVVEAANPLCTGLPGDIVADIEFVGTIKSADLICGDVKGMVMSPVSLSLNGSTFGAVRVTEPVMTGDANLPTAVAACP